MIAEKKPFVGREQDLSPTKDLLPHARGTSWLDAKLDAVSADAFRFRWFMIASGVVALAWVAFVGSVMLRPDATPKAAAALPPLLSAVPPLAEEASDSPRQTIESGRLSEAPRDASDEAVAPPASTTGPSPGNAPLAQARKATGRNDAAPAVAAPKPVAAPTPPPAKLITVTTRTFHPPVISWFYKGMVADKMKEEGLDPRLEAKVRGGQQLTVEDLASVPKPVMEKINAKVVAYGQPPLYTDVTTTVLAGR